MNKIPENEIKHLKTLIPLRSKETVGYKEAENKESFNAGVGVGMMIAIEEMQNKFGNIYQSYDYYKKMFEDRQNDLNTLVNIINKYLPE